MDIWGKNSRKILGNRSLSRDRRNNNNRKLLKNRNLNNINREYEYEDREDFNNDKKVIKNRRKDPNYTFEPEETPR